jgi:hypothetical protein
MGTVQKAGVEAPGAIRYLLRFTVYTDHPKSPEQLTAFGWIEPLIELGLIPESFFEFSVEIAQVQIKNSREERVKVEIYDREG